MSKSYEVLKTQMNDILKQIEQPQNIHINQKLGLMLDTLDVPEYSKVALLAIDTAMVHLDRISFYHFERDAILIGDLFSAHYYYLLSELQSHDFQKQMSQAIVKMNTLKSYLQNEHQHIHETEQLDHILNIEFALIDALLDVYQIQDIKATMHHRIIAQLKVDQLTYLNFLDEQAIETIIKTLQAKINHNGVG